VLVTAWIALTCCAPADGSAAQATLPLRWTHTLNLQGAQPAATAAQWPQSASPDSTRTAALEQAELATPWSLLLAQASEQADANRAADAGSRAADGAREQAWASAWMPRVDLNAAASRRQQQVNNTRVDTPTTTTGLSAALPLWRAGDRAVAQSQSAVAEQARWQARLSRANVARELSLAYLSAIEAAELRQLAVSQQALLSEQQRLNERRLQGGAGTVLDVLETRTRLDQVRAGLTDIDTRLATQHLTLSRLTRSPVRLSGGWRGASDALPLIVPPLTEALSLAQDRNPTVQEAQAQVQAARATESARHADQWQPTVDAVASATRVREVPQLDGIRQRQTTTERNLGVQMNWPLFTGGAQSGRTREAAALLDRAQARLDDALSQAHTTLRDAYQTLAQAQQALHVQRQVEDSATATYEALRKAFVAGMRTNLDLLNAQQQIQQARQSVVGTRIRGLSAQVLILSTLDQLDPEHLAPLMPLFAPTALHAPAAP